jgi:endonuclease/exonuclease/phosphatase (EEP) superfamily protein YafD
MTFLRFGFAASLWIAALGLLAASCLAQGGRFSARLDVLTHFAPIYLAAALAVLALALVAWRDLGLIAVAGLAAVASAALMAPEFLTPDRSPRAAHGAGEIKLIQFNAWGGNPSPDAAVRWLIAQDPDVIVLEEASGLRDRLLAAGYHLSCGYCSAVVFSRAEPVATYGEPREPGRSSYISSATFRDPRGAFTVVAVHRHWPVRFAKDRAQTAKLRAYLADLPKARLILAGDFNSTPWSFARRREDRELGLIRRTRAVFTWPAAQLSHNRLPAPFPYLPIDHVYAGSGWSTVEVARGPALGSDHYPVIVTLAPADGEAR